MNSLDSYIVGSREFKTDDGILLASEAEEVHKGRAERCQKLVNDILELNQTSGPTFTISTEYLKDILNHLAESTVLRFYVASHDRPVLVLSDNNTDFAIVMQRANVKVSYPVIKESPTGIPEEF